MARVRLEGSKIVIELELGSPLSPDCMGKIRKREEGEC